MKMKVLVFAAVAAALVFLTCCNKEIIDTTYKYDKAIITLPSGDVVEGKVQSWNDYEGEQIQVKINGVVYLVQAENAVLIKE